MDGTVQRAFEIARSGTCQTIGEIRAQLKQEDYTWVAEHLAGLTIQKQLRLLIKAAQPAV